MQTGGSFAPPLSDEALSKYKALAEKLPATSAVRDAMTKLHACCCHWWELPDSAGTDKRMHASGRGTVVPLDEPSKKELWELIPWTHELEAFKTLFDTINPTAEKELRDAAHHLLWHVVELDLDREPLTNDQL